MVGLAGLPPVWLAVLTIACGSLDARPGLAADEPVAKVVRRYALTSANDFPQRDPRDWRLLASNDGGKTWVTLDTRKGEVFSERHQRRVFQLTNTQAFNLYRLQIDRVLDPAAATCVQLAEIVPLGAADEDLDPLPSFQDLITAKGENAPVESRLEAFDGQVETKWLDHADQEPATRASWIQWQYLSPVSLVVTNVSQLLGLRSQASRGYPLRIEGVVVGRLPGTSVLCFLDATGPLEVAASGAEGELAPGQRVLLTGTSQWTNKQAGAAGCRLQRRGPKASAEPRPIALEQPLAPEDNLQWVEAEGEIQFCTRLENSLAFDLQDGGRTLRVHVLHLDPAARPPLAGTRVRVRGLCEGVLNDHAERVAGTLWVPASQAVLPAGLAGTATNAPGSSVPPAAAGGPAEAALLAHVKEIRQLSPEQLRLRPKVSVRGVVTEPFGVYLQEGSAGVEVWSSHPGAADQPELRRIGADRGQRRLGRRARTHYSRGEGGPVGQRQAAFPGALFLEPVGQRAGRGSMGGN